MSSDHDSSSERPTTRGAADVGSRETDAAAAQVLAAVAEFDHAVAALVAQFPAEEADQVRAGVYRDAGGVVRTRHRSLRLL